MRLGAHVELAAGAQRRYDRYAHDARCHRNVIAGHTAVRHPHRWTQHGLRHRVAPVAQEGAAAGRELRPRPTPPRLGSEAGALVAELTRPHERGAAAHAVATGPDAVAIAWLG
eukprot:3602899-Prymnesium_polylepis.2